MDVIKKEIELGENMGYEYRIVLPTKLEMSAVLNHDVMPSRIAHLVVAVYRYAYYHPHHKTHVYEFDGVETQ